MFSSDGLRHLISNLLPYRHLQDAPIPVHVVATNLLSGEEVLLSTDDAISAVLASTAIPGLLPAVHRDGLVLVDRGLANNAGISQAVALGAERIFVLPTGVACALTRPPASPFAAAMQALSFLTQQRLIHDVIAFAEHAELHVLPPLCPLGISSADFNHARELTDRSRRATSSWLDGGRDRLAHPERFLSLHQHTYGPPPRSLTQPPQPPHGGRPPNCLPESARCSRFLLRTLSAGGYGADPAVVGRAGFPSGPSRLRVDVVPASRSATGKRHSPDLVAGD